MTSSSIPTSRGATDTHGDRLHTPPTPISSVAPVEDELERPVHGVHTRHLKLRVQNWMDRAGWIQPEADEKSTTGQPAATTTTDVHESTAAGTGRGTARVPARPAQRSTLRLGWEPRIYVTSPDDLPHAAIEREARQLELDTWVDGFIDTTIGGVTIDALVGVGGMGAVFRGTRGISTVPVAIKLMVPWLASRPDAVRRFLREADAHKRLRHPHIVPVLDSGFDDGQAYIVMSYIAGGAGRAGGPDSSGNSGTSGQPGTLRELLERSTYSRIDEPHVRELFRPLLEALEYAHSQGFIHRDLSPGNVLLDEDGTPYLSDFGLVRMLGDDPTDFGQLPMDDADGRAGRQWHGARSTRAGTVVGTPPYMSPEQCAGRLLDQRSDLYAMGCMMYRALCGRPPFISPSAFEILQMHTIVAPIAPEFIRPTITRDLDSIIRRLLCKSPGARFATAAAVVEALDHGYREPTPRADRASRIDPARWNDSFRPVAIDELRGGPRRGGIGDPAFSAAGTRRGGADFLRRNRPAVGTERPDVRWRAGDLHAGVLRTPDCDPGRHCRRREVAFRLDANRKRTPPPGTTVPGGVNSDSGSADDSRPGRAQSS